jgi:DNA polymerase III subunit beta
VQIVTDAKELSNCLEIVEKSLPIRSTIPVISNIMLEINQDNLTFSSTNLEMFIKVKMDYQGSETGRILLPPKIVDIMRYFPTSEVTISINFDNYRIDISGGSADFHLYGSDPEEYPAAFEGPFDSEEGFSLGQAVFKKTLKSVAFAASNEETRPAFNGIFFSFKNDQITLTASDTYRLVIKELHDQKWNFDEEKCLVPARSMRELLRILGDTDTELTLITRKNMLAFKFDRIFFASRLLEEKYPDVSGVIPKEYKTRISIDRKKLEDTVSRATLLAEGKNQAVHFIVKNEQLEARVASQEGSMEEVLEVEQEGDDLELFVNTRFVLDILKIMEAERITIDFHGDGGPLIFRLVDDLSYLYLVLPIKKVN